MPAYQLHFLGEDARRITSQEIEAEDDYEAFNRAQLQADSHTIEVWDGRRLIATAEPLKLLKPPEK